MPSELTTEQVDALLLDANLAAARFFKTRDPVDNMEWALASWRLSNAGQTEAMMQSARERLERR